MLSDGCLKVNAEHSDMQIKHLKKKKCTLRNVECKISKKFICRISPVKCFANYTLQFFCIPQSAFRKIQIKSNNQLCVGLGLHLSLKSTSAHHKQCGPTVDKIITYTDVFNLTIKTTWSPLAHERKLAHHTRMQGQLK